jgi:uncharacterized BrkB/YihY/UPF0761 family membrane protein
MDNFYRHALLCILTGLVTLLPIGGTILLIVFAERSLSPLIPAKFVLATDLSVDKALKGLFSLGKA